MAEVRAMVDEDYKYTIILPRYTNDGKYVNPDVLKHFAREIMKHFGGFTAHPWVLGCWYDPEAESPDKEYVCELNELIFAGRDLDEPEDVAYQCDYLEAVYGGLASPNPPAPLRADYIHLMNNCTRENIINFDRKFIDYLTGEAKEVLDQFAIYHEEEPTDIELQMQNKYPLSQTAQELKSEVPSMGPEQEKKKQTFILGY